MRTSGHPKTLQYPRHPQTHHHTTSVKNKHERQRRTEEQTERFIRSTL